jgi:hypothetical protein
MTMPLKLQPCVLALTAILALEIPAAAEGTRVRGEITDSTTGNPIPCRVYIEAADGAWYFPKSEAKAGLAVEYRKQRPGTPPSVEMHTTLSAHPFAVSLPAGRYTVTVELVRKDSRPLVRR